MDGYLGPKVFLAGCARACKQQESRNFPGANDTVCSSFGYTFRIGGMKQNPGPGIEGYSIIQVLCSGSDRILKSGTMVASTITADRLHSWIEDGDIGKVGLQLNRRGVISAAKDRPEEISDSIWQ